MSLGLRLLRTKRRGDGLDFLVYVVIVIAVLAFFGFISIHL